LMEFDVSKGKKAYGRGEYLESKGF